MSTLNSSLSRVQYYDRKKDFIVDFKDDSHVRLMKLFPMCNEKKEPSLSHYKRFHLRFYMPREIYHDKYLKANKLFIFINGLDEIDYFNLYDQLGQGLAKYGYASVLLPLPDHLNRNKQYRHEDEKYREKPSSVFIKERKRIYDAYLQALRESKILIDHVRCQCKHINSKEECSFYNHFFDNDVRISILGYSLGGLGAMSHFLLEKDTFNTCILLSSGAQLAEIDVSHFIPIDKWTMMVNKIQEDWEVPFDRAIEAKTIEAKIFDKIFLGNRTGLLKNELREVSRKILFILSEADTVTKYKSIRSIEPEGHGLAVLKLPGISHFLSIDTEWNKWFKIIINMIAQFDESSFKESLSHSEIPNELIKFQIKYNIFDGPSSYSKNRVDHAGDEHDFYRILYAAESCFGNLPVAIIEMYLFLEKAKKHPGLFPISSDYPHQDLLGSLACEEYKLPEEIIRNILEIQKKYAIAEKRIPKFGKLLIREKYLNKAELSKLLNIQKQNRQTRIQRV